MDVEALMASNRFYHDNRHCKALNKIGAIENRRHRKAGGKATQNPALTRLGRDKNPHRAETTFRTRRRGTSRR